MTQTCSLACHKKHQQRSSCSGKRDPAAYLKKRDLSTPTGLDQDYNYLKSIERQIDSAETDTAQRVNDAPDGKPRNVATGWRSDSKLQAYLAEHRITVERAPRGMQRQRDSTLRSTRGHRALWTIEWVTDGGERELQHDCAEASAIRDLFAFSKLGRKRKAQGRAADDELNRKQNPTKKHKTEPISPRIKDEPDLAPTDNVGISARPEKDSKDPAMLSAESVSPSTTPVEQAPKSEDGRESSTRFYLRRPATASASKVLIPLRANATLTKSLEDQIVQEYPTIYVMPYDADNLPDGFVLFSQYLVERKQDEVELSTVQQRVPSSTHRNPEVSLERSQQLDANSILNMLKRDVATR
jgi:hypothetical protein